MFEELKNELNNYEELLQSHVESYEDIYKNTCGLFDIAKALVYDFGFYDAQKLAKAILALGELDRQL